MLFTILLPACQNKSSQNEGTSFIPHEPYHLLSLQSRAVTRENPGGEKGKACLDKGNGNMRKGQPAFRKISPGETKILCDIEGSGIVRHIWMTTGVYRQGFVGRMMLPDMLRSYVIRIYWDNSPYPSVEAPMGDFFGVAHGRTAHFMTPYIGTPEGRGYQCYFPMPFSERCKITFENQHSDTLSWLFYQIDYTLGEKIEENTGRFHAHFRRDTPPAGEDFVLLDTKGSPGVFMGAVVGVNPLSPGWWGEGEMKFYIDGDTTYPTICGTGTEDYLCSAWGMNAHDAFYTGVNYIRKNPETNTDQFVSFYRIHYWDPIFFQKNLRVELQQIGAGWNETDANKYGWKGPHIHPDNENPGKILSSWLYDRSDDYSSVVYWYQKVTDTPLPPLPSVEKRVKGISLQPWEKTTEL